MIAGGTQLRQQRLVNAMHRENLTKPRQNHILVHNVQPKMKESLLKKPKAPKNAVAKPHGVEATEKQKAVPPVFPSDEAGVDSGKSPIKLRCFNAKCKVEITELNKYGRHGDSWTHCQACEDIVDPYAKMIRERNKCLPSCDSIYQRA